MFIGVIQKDIPLFILLLLFLLGFFLLLLYAFGPSELRTDKH